jgi:hypothetical protein
MLNLAVRIVTTAIQIVQVYRICMCYFFTKYNNNIASRLSAQYDAPFIGSESNCLFM